MAHISYFKQPTKKKKAKKKTAEEEAYLEAVAQLNCMVCGSYPVEVHHVRDKTGLSVRPSHFETIPLCFNCHRGTFSVHNCKKSFEAKYGTQNEMIEKTKRIIKNEL